MQWLPHDSALHRAVDPEGAGVGWDLGANLLALIAEILDVGNVMYIQAHVEQGVKVRDPLRIPRPGAPEPRMKPEKAAMTTRNLIKSVRHLGGRVKHTPRRERTSG